MNMSYDIYGIYFIYIQAFFLEIRKLLEGFWYCVQSGVALGPLCYKLCQDISVA